MQNDRNRDLQQERIDSSQESRENLIQAILDSNLTHEQKKELTNMSDDQMVVMGDYLKQKSTAQEAAKEHDYRIVQAQADSAGKWRS